MKRFACAYQVREKNIGVKTKVYWTRAEDMETAKANFQHFLDHQCKMPVLCHAKMYMMD